MKPCPPRAMLFYRSYPPWRCPSVTEAPAFPGNFVKTAQTLDGAHHRCPTEAAALGRWPNGAKLSKEQQGLAWKRCWPGSIGTYRGGTHGLRAVPAGCMCKHRPGAYAPSLARRRVSGELTHRATGTLEKMRATVEGDGTVAYRLPLGDSEISLNPLLGRRLQLRFEDAIYCTACGKTNKSFNQKLLLPLFSETCGLRQLHRQPGKMPLRRWHLPRT